MILGAGLLLLLGLGLLVAGVLTGVTALYWGCVAVCLVAAALLVVVRRQMADERATADRVMADGTSTAREDERGEPRATSRRLPDRQRSHAWIPTASQPPDRAPEPQTAVLPVADAGRSPAPETAGDPPLEEVEVTDLLVVMDLRDEVLVVDEHPRYHLSGCAHLTGRETFPMPMDEARSDGFTPCGTCAPDRHLAQQARERKAGRH